MSLYTEIQADIFLWTNRKKMIAETDLAIRGAIRKAHRAGTFYRDLQTVTISSLPTNASVQNIDLSASCPSYRQLYTIVPTGSEGVAYQPSDLRELLDQDNLPRYDIYWVVGTTLSMRPRFVSESVDVTYYKRPDVDDLASLSDWIATEHRDLIVLWAAATILALVGEQEIKSRVEALAKLAYDDLIADSVEIIGR